jgi:metal-responsive CopG/Arc/MetJ family transcriptional regulator
MSQYPQINVRVDDEFLAKLDNWRRHQPDLPNRPEAVRRLVEQALSKPEPKSAKEPNSRRRQP